MKLNNPFDSLDETFNTKDKTKALEGNLKKTREENNLPAPVADAEKDLELRQRNTQERARLIQKMLSDKKAGKPTQVVKAEQRIHYHCDTLEDGKHDNHQH